MRKLKEILLIDEDQISNYLNKELLEELGIAQRVNIMEDGEAAYHYLLACADSNPEACPELIIFDLQMPGMDGLELLEALHKVNFAHEHKAVFMSLDVHHVRKDVDVLKSFGVHEFSTKPLSSQVIMELYQKYW